MSLNVILLVICLLLSGFFSSAETALFSISKFKALHLAKEGGKTDQLIYKMKENPHRLLSTILIGNNIVNIGASSLATAIAIDFFQSNAVGIATGVMTILILIFGEIFPKSFAAQNKIFVARAVIFPIMWISKLFTPIIFILTFIPKLLGKADTTPSVTEDELMTMVEVVEGEGEIKEEERELISNIFEFDDTSASEIMTPRADMYVIDINDPIDIRAILNSGFTRIPVIDNNIDSVIGILNVKDLFARYHDSCSHQMNITNESAQDENDDKRANGDDNSPKDDSSYSLISADTIGIREIMREPFFIPESKKLDSLLHAFKQMKNHIGIVVDEHGGVCGIVTMEDVLEELVGEIDDETDRNDPHIVQLHDDKWIVLGKTEIQEINKTLNLSIPESPDYDTFSGFILDKIGKIPKVGETITIDRYAATVKERDGNRIRTFVFKLF
ncbi:MAG: HlyC/CorC family transporter [Desulfamplus sp.]|nr:HlyC/CorC family transporter [Desulfamplus sp.]